MPDDRTVEIRGGTVTFRVLAAGRGAPLVYFHSYHERSAWSPFLDLLARTFTVYAPSHPGVSGSTGIETRPRSPRSFRHARGASRSSRPSASGETTRRPPTF